MPIFIHLAINMVMIIDGSKLKRRRVEEDELEVKDATINATGDSTDLNTQEFNDRDVDDMSDAEVMNYAFINMPKNISSDKKQALLTRASDISRSLDTQSGTQHKQFVDKVGNYMKDFLNNGGGLQSDE